jgi:hypothetical protein
MLKNLRNLIAETQEATKRFLKDKGTNGSSTLNAHVTIKEEKTAIVKQTIH